MRTYHLSIVLAFLPLGVIAQEQSATAEEQPVPTQQTEVQQPQEVSNQAKEQPQKKSSPIFTGFSGGMMIHGGYLFSDDPRKVFSSSGLGNEDYVKGLPQKGFCFGLGGALRVHLLDHIHVGAEGFVSTMPLMGTGSNIRSGWGGGFCDVYTTFGKIHPFIGITVGGGAMRRLYVPDQAASVNYMTSDSTYYNAAYTKTPFFLLDPYIGLEISLRAHLALLIRIDYMLPFGKTNSRLTDNVKWSNFMSPSGPRLYVGVMFGKNK